MNRWTDLEAVRGDERLICEAKGRTSEKGIDADIAYGQLLRRMTSSHPHTRYALVVPSSSVKAVERVAAHVRKLLRIDVYEVTDDDVVRRPSAWRGSRPRPLRPSARRSAARQPVRWRIRRADVVGRPGLMMWAIAYSSMSFLPAQPSSSWTCITSCAVRNAHDLCHGPGDVLVEQQLQATTCREPST
jgi:hypothetical protein